MILSPVLLVLLIILALVPSAVVLLVCFLWIEAVKNTCHRLELTIDEIRKGYLDIGTRFVTVQDVTTKGINRIDIVEGKIMSVDESIMNLNNKLSARSKAEEMAEKRRRKKEEEEEQEEVIAPPKLPHGYEQTELFPVEPIASGSPGNESAPKQPKASGRLRRVSRLQPV